MIKLDGTENKSKLGGNAILGVSMAVCKVASIEKNISLFQYLNDISNNKNKKFLSNQEYQLYLFTPDRKEIYNRVNQRFINMIYRGAIDEVKKLNTLDFDKSLPIMRAHGVPEISNYLSGKTTLEECIHKGQQATRNYVKRQLTWWRSSSLENLKCFDQFPSEIDANLLNFS